MKAPKCKLCGSEHYSTEPHVFSPGGARASVKAPVTKVLSPAVTKSRTIKSAVTKESLREPVPRLVPQSRVSALEVEIEMLQGEIKALKRQLSGRSDGGRIGRPPLGDRPMTGAERTRKARAKRKPKSGTMEFRG